jgi:transcriptional regulator with XRE-family HTH domain
MTQAEVARKAGVDRRTVIRWESGGYLPVPSVLDVLVEIKAVSVSDRIRLRRLAVGLPPDSGRGGYSDVDTVNY